MNIEIADRLQKLRKEKGFSQEQLAEELGISRQAVSKWERAEASPDTDNLICLARLYGVSLDELLYTDQSSSNIAKEVREKTEKEGMKFVDDENNSVCIEEGKIKFYDGETQEKVEMSIKDAIGHRDKKHIIKDSINGAIMLLSIIGYIILGTIEGMWHPGWLIFLAALTLMTFVDAIVDRKLSSFGFPLLVTLIYLAIGFILHGWHPYWFLFLTVPIYYAIADPIDKYVFKTKPVNNKENKD